MDCIAVFRAENVSIDPPFGESRFEFTVLTWQFPVLGKYRFRPESRVRPTVEAGPSFRLSGNLNGYKPSRSGFTTGAGIEADYDALRVAPALRYTRWGADSRLWFMSADTARNQLEFLVSLTFLTFLTFTGNIRALLQANANGKKARVLRPERCFRGTEV